MSYIEEQKVGDLTVVVETDDDPMNPRVEWDNVCQFPCWHGRCSLGDAAKRGFAFKTPNDFLRSLQAVPAIVTAKDPEGWNNDKLYKYKNGYIWPVYMYDHSWQTVRIGHGFSDMKKKKRLAAKSIL